MATSFQTFRAAMTANGYTFGRYDLTSGSRYYNMGKQADTTLTAMGIPFKYETSRGRVVGLQVERKDADAIITGKQAPAVVQVAVPAPAAKTTRRSPDQIAQERAEKKAKELERERLDAIKWECWQKATATWKEAGNTAEGGLIGYTKDDQELRFLTPAQERAIQKIAKGLVAQALA